LRVAFLIVLLKNTILLLPFSACVTNFSPAESYFWRFSHLCSVVIVARHFLLIANLFFSLLLSYIVVRHLLILYFVVRHFIATRVLLNVTILTEAAARRRQRRRQHGDGCGGGSAAAVAAAAA
jgi:hypothetical protein